jgi:hypothetical protein
VGLGMWSGPRRYGLVGVCVSQPPWFAPSMNVSLMAMDVSKFGAFSDDVKRGVRDALYQILQRAFAEGGVTLADCYVEDRGDGVLVPSPQGWAWAS